MKPTKDVIFRLVLYAGQGVIQLDRDVPWRPIPVDFLLITVRDGANGGDDSGCSTTESFVGLHGKVGCNFPLHHFIVKVASELDDGVARDSREDGPR